LPCASASLLCWHPEDIEAGRREKGIAVIIDGARRIVVEPIDLDDEGIG
jgi:selenocysteine lyase/cysteine desulfurase